MSNMSARDRKILILMVPVMLLAAYWFLVLAPKREEATIAAAELTEQQDRVEAAKTASQAGDQAEETFEASYSQVVRLGKAIPSSVDMPSLLVQLDAAATGTGITFTKIATGDRVASAAAAPVPAPAPPADGSTPAADAGGEAAETDQGAAAESADEAAQTADAQAEAAEQSGVDPADTQTSTSTGEGGLAVGGGAAPIGDPAAGGTAPAGLETVPLTLEFQGNFFNLADFFHRVKRFVRIANQDVLVSGRLLTVESVRWSSDAEIFPRLRAEMAATIYLSPKAEGVTAGATPQGPSETTPAGTTTTPAEGTPAPAAPTATATP